MEGDCQKSTLKPQPAIFSSDAQAKKIRDEIDFSQRITLERAKSGDVPRPVRVYTDGIFDMFHYGHAKQIMQAKHAFPCEVYVIAGVCSDEDTAKMKGKTVATQEERSEAIDFVAHDAVPFTFTNAPNYYKPFFDAGMFLETERTIGISTSDMITRIIRSYEDYVKRNLSRGYTAADLNLSQAFKKDVLGLNGSENNNSK